jgi:hypothetical protein
MVDTAAVPNPLRSSCHNCPSFPFTLSQTTQSGLSIMTEEPTTPPTRSDQTVRLSDHPFQSLLPTEVNVDRPAITVDEAYEIYQKVRDGQYCYPEDTPRSPTDTPFQGAQGAVTMYTQTPHHYHDQLGYTEQQFDKHMLDHLEVHFEGGSVFGERIHIQTTGKEDDLTATKVTIFYALGPDGIGCEWNAGIGLRPIRLTATHATDNSGTFRPVSYEITPVKIEEKDRSCLSRPQDFVSVTPETCPITSLLCPDYVGSHYYPVERTYRNESQGKDVHQPLVLCWTDTDGPRGDSPPGRIHLLPADIGKEVEEAVNTTGFSWDNSFQYRCPPRKPVSQAPPRSLSLLAAWAGEPGCGSHRRVPSFAF